MSDKVWTFRLPGRKYTSPINGKGFQYFGRYNAFPNVSVEAWVYDKDKKFLTDRVEDSPDMLFKVKLGPHQLPNIQIGGLEAFLRQAVEQAIEAHVATGNGV